MSGLRILVTGSRDWTDQDAIATALAETAAKLLPTDRYRAVTLVHGAARGADSIAAEVAEFLGWGVAPYPAAWATFGKSAGHRRNAVMVASGADICLAFPLGESRGTRGCMRLAEKAGIRVINYGEGVPS